MGVDDDLGPAEGARGLLGESQEHGSVTLALEVAANGDEAKAGLHRVDQIDAHGAYDLAIANQHMREMAWLEFVRVVLVVGLPWQQAHKDRIPADGVIAAPLLRRSHRSQRITLERIAHGARVELAPRLPL